MFLASKVTKLRFLSNLGEKFAFCVVAFDFHRTSVVEAALRMRNGCPVPFDLVSLTLEPTLFSFHIIFI